MPGTALGGVEARIAALVEARRPVLKELVRQTVDRELVALVDAELDRALAQLANGNAPRRRTPRVPRGITTS